MSVFHPQQNQFQQDHQEEHLLGQQPIFTAKFCLLCYPIRSQRITQQFRNFWDWISGYCFAESYTAYTLTVFELFITVFRTEVPTDNLLTKRLTDFAYRLLGSLLYQVQPSHQHLIYYLINLVPRTGYFSQPVQPRVFLQLKDVIDLQVLYPELTTTFDEHYQQRILDPVDSTLAQLNINQRSLLFTQDELNLDSLFTQNTMTISQDQLRILLNDVLGQNGLNIPQLSTQLNTAITQIGNQGPAQIQAQVQVPARELSLIKVTDFHEKDDEDPYTWLDTFKQAAIANNWADNVRKLEIAKGYLKDAASDWIRTATDANAQNQIVRFLSGGANEDITSFDTRFLQQFASETKQNKWFYELMSLRQVATESVNDYSLRFQRLLRKVATNQVIPDQMQIRLYLYGLNPLLTPLVSTASPANLNAAIERAKIVETGYNYVPTKDISLKVPPAVKVNPTTPVQPQKETTSDVDALTQQLQQLSLNLAMMAKSTNNNNKPRVNFQNNNRSI